MKSKPRLGRKDIFADSQVSRNEESKIPVKKGKKKIKKSKKQTTIKTENQQRIKATFQIPEDLFIQIKIKAAKDRRKISDLVADMLSKYFTKEKEG